MTSHPQRGVKGDRRVKRKELGPKLPYLKSPRKYLFSIKTLKMYTYYLKTERRLFIIERIYKHHHTTAYFYFIKIP